MGNEWLVIGLILALELIYATGVAAWTRWAANAKLQGQTIWHVAVGVAGTVLITGLRIGFDAVGFVLICFAVASIPMGIEYFGRLKRVEDAAQMVMEESVNVEPGADRKE